MRRVLFWLAIGVLGAASPAAATYILRASNCKITPVTFTVYDNYCVPTDLQVTACATRQVGCYQDGCQIGQTCTGATTWPSDVPLTLSKQGMEKTSDLNTNPPLDAATWQLHCECPIGDMRW